MSSMKKRKASKASYDHSEDGSSSKLTSSRRKISGRRPANMSKETQQHLEDMKSLYQQRSEKISAVLARKAQEHQNGAISDEDLIKVAHYLRHYSQQAKDDYARPPGMAMAMGNDESNQLGIFTMMEKEEGTTFSDQYLPTPVGNMTENNIIQAAAGGLHSLALTQTGKVYSWGVNDEGQLGRKTSYESNDEGASEVSPHPIDDSNFSPEDKNRVVAIAAGETHSIFQTINGNLYMCGMYKDTDSGRFRETMPGSNEGCKGFQETPVPVHRLQQKVKKVACGNAFNAAILHDGTMVTWGMGHQGELARSRDMIAVSKDKHGNETYEIGKSFITETRKDEEGEEYSAYLPEKVWEYFLMPKPPLWKTNPRFKREVHSIACGAFHLLVSAKDGDGAPSLFASGLNQYGQLGLGDYINRHELTPVPSLENKAIVSMAAGEHFSIVMDVTGTQVYTFGRSDYGQLGRFEDKQPTGGFDPYPGIVTFPDVFLKQIGHEEAPVIFSHVDAGDRTAFVTTSEGDVFAWGFGETGATGLVNLEDSDVNIPHLVDVHQKSSKKKYCVRNVAPGGQHTLMVCESKG